jgi:XTP/dITP diphosphohydrolase
VTAAWPAKLVIASHNEGKVAEIRELLAPHGVEVVSAGELGLEEPEETGATFTANALLKAHAAAEASDLPALADDSGLAVPALGGAPGIHSARWAGPRRDFNAAMARLEREMAGHSDRRAAFVCVLAYALPGGEARCFEGRVAGRLSFPPRGDNGFGYDPVFVPEGRDMTFGEMEPAEKTAMSHRARAFKKLLAAFDG